jgi:uncharacterized protein YoxC
MTAGPLATTTVGETAALVAAIAVAILVLGLLAALVSLIGTLRTLRETADELRRTTVPLVSDVRETVAQANAGLERVDGLLVTAESISTTVDSASRLAYLAFSNPVVKVLAFSAGTARAARSLRKR